MTPEEAKARYEAEWPALNVAKEAAMNACDAKAAKKCRQLLSALSQRYAARFELNRTPEAEPQERVCPCCGFVLSE